MDVAPCQKDLHAYSSSWLLQVEFCWASWLVSYSGLLGHCRKICFATKVGINCSFFQEAGLARVWVQYRTSSSPRLGPPRALCSVCADRLLQAFKALSWDGRNTNLPGWCLVPFWALSWPLLGTADPPPPVPRATVVPYKGLSGLGNKFQCLGYCPALSHPSMEFRKTSAYLDYPGICCEIEWSRASVSPLEVPKVFCIPNKIFVLVVSPLVNVNRETSSRKQSDSVNSAALCCSLDGAGAAHSDDARDGHAVLLLPSRLFQWQL